MKKRTCPPFALPASLLLVFVLYTLALTRIDVRPVGPQSSLVGFSTLNAWVHRLVGVHMTLYTVTDWLGLIAFFVALGFALLGLRQLIQRKHLLLVDHSILALGLFYVLVMASYLFFEVFVINSRPVLIHGVLEASYPSSTTMLVMCIMPTAMMQFHRRIPSKAVRIPVQLLCGGFTAFMVIGRLLSGVHWLSDIVGGILLSAALVSFYAAAITPKGA